MTNAKYYDIIKLHSMYRGSFMIERVQFFDDIVLSWMGKFHTPRRNRIMKFFSKIGDKGLAWFTMCIILVIYAPWRFFGANVIVGLAIAHLAGEIIIKHIVARTRPCHKLEDDQLVVKRPKYYSFPSGHTTSSFAVFAVTLFRCWPLAILVFFIAAMIALSRMYLRVHYLTDVVAGVLLGFACGSLSVIIFNTMTIPL